MNLLYLSKKQITRNMFIYIISVILVAISIIIFNSTYSSVQSLFSELKFAYGFNDQRLYVSEPNINYYESLDRQLSPEESKEYIEKILDGYCKEMNLTVEKGSDDYYSLLNNYDCMIRWSNQHHEELGSSFTFEFRDKFIDLLKDSEVECSPLFTYSVLINPIIFNNCDCSAVHIIDYGIAERLKMNLLKGKDLKNITNSENNIEAIAVGSDTFIKNVKIGDNFEISLFNFKKNEYEKFTVKIVGVLGSPFYLLGGYASFVEEDLVSLDKLISRNYYSKEKSGGSFQLITLPFEGFDTKDYLAAPNPTYYFTLNNSSEENTNNLKRILVSHGYDTVSVKKAYQNTFKEIIKELLSDIVIILLAFVLSLSTIFGAIVLNIYNNHKTHYILMICGASLKHHIKICAMNTFTMCLHSTLLSMIYFAVSNYIQKQKYGELFGINFDYYNLIITLAIVIIATLTSIISSRKIYSETLYKKNNVIGCKK